MESTGTYWQSLFITLQGAGLDVILCNGKFTKNIKGKKTDVKDCQWIQKLHTIGLLSGSFLPDEATEELRTYCRHRANLLEQAADTSQKRINKNTPDININLLSYQYFEGVDLLSIEGVSHSTVLTLMSEVGHGIYKFQSAKQFASWLRLAPNNKISGGRILSNKIPKGSNRLKIALRQAANVIGNLKDTALSNFFKRIAFPGSPTPGGQTSPIYNKSTGTVTTIFDSQSFLNATELSWARTILHESVHAYLIAYFNNDQPAFIKNYPQMVQDWGTLQNWNAVHHEEFARSLVTAIADALQEYGINKGYTLSRQFYEDMSWAGLQATSAFQNLSSSDQTRILDTISIELSGQDSQGTPQTQKGTNAGC